MNVDAGEREASPARQHRDAREGARAVSAGPHLQPMDGGAGLGHYTACLHLEFADAIARATCAAVLASLFSSVAKEVLAIDTTGRAREDLDASELTQWI